MNIELDDHEKELIKDALASFREEYINISNKFRQDVSIYVIAINKAKELEKLRYKFV